MSQWTDTILVVVVLTNLVLLGSSRLGACIRVVAVQGIVVGLLPLFTEAHLARSISLSAAIIILKGGVFPWLLSRALREADVRREVEPFVGYSLSMVIGIASLLMSLWLGSRIASVQTGVQPLIVAVAISTLLDGVFLIISRRKALNQVLGYVVMENGIYAFGLALVGGIHFLVELGILLDVFVGVFVMGIAIYHINREFDHMDADQLSTLKG